MIGLEEIQDKYEKIVIWGAGSTFINSFSGNMKIDYIVDSDRQKWGEIIGNNLKIESPEKLLTEDPTRTAIIICSIYWREIAAEIRNAYDVYLDVMIQPSPFQKNLMYKSGFSLFAEDAMIKGIADRYHIDVLHYVDIGANHPYFGNASVLFYLNGATGCLVEPNARLIPLLEKCRVNDLVINKGVSSQDNNGKSMIYYDVEDIDTISTFSKEVVEKYRKKKIPYMEKCIEMICLNSLLDEYAEKVNYISIDVEGGEFEILKDFDFKKYDIEFLNIEKGDNRCISLILENGYEKAGETPSNWIFIKNGIIHEEY